MPNQTLAEFVSNHPVCLHLGAHKTATTFLQNTLNENAVDLAQAGVGLVLPRHIRAKSDPKRANASAKVRVDAALADALDDPKLHRLVLSEEGLIGSPRRNLLQAELYAEISSNLQALPYALDHPNVQIFFAVRDYGPYFSSCVTTALRSGHAFDLLDLRRNLLITPRGWAEVIADIEQRFPKAQLVLWSYEDFEMKPEAILAEMTGLPLKAPSKRVFETMTQKAVETVMPLIAANVSPTLRRDVIRDAMRAFPTGPDTPKFTLWNNEEAALLNERYQVDWKRVQDRWPGAILN